MGGLNKFDRVIVIKMFYGMWVSKIFEPIFTYKKLEIGVWNFFHKVDKGQMLAKYILIYY